MAFPRRHLAGGEDVVLETRPHWTYLGWAPCVVLALVGLLVALTVAWSSAPVDVGWALAVLVGLALLWLAGRLLRWWRTALVVTTTRLVQRSGVLARRGVEVRLERINEISYRQSVGERLVGSGRLYLDTGGDRGTLAFDHVRRPAVVSAVLHQQADVRRRPAQQPAWTRSPDDTPPAGTPPAGTPPARV